MSETESVRQSDTPVVPVEVPRHAWPKFDPNGVFEFMGPPRTYTGELRYEGDPVPPEMFDRWTLRRLYDAHLIRPVGLVVKSTLSTAEDRERTGVDLPPAVPSSAPAADALAPANGALVVYPEPGEGDPFHVELAHALHANGLPDEDVGAAVAAAVQLEQAEADAVSDSRTPEEAAQLPSVSDSRTPDAAPTSEPAPSAPAAPPRKLDPNRPKHFRGR